MRCGKVIGGGAAWFAFFGGGGNERVAGVQMAGSRSFSDGEFGLELQGTLCRGYDGTKSNLVCSRPQKEL